jgi:lysozyme
MSLGIDCAGVDENGNPDWTKAKTEGPIRFAFLRGTYGDSLDSKFTSDWPAIKAAGITRGAYLFLRFPLKRQANQVGPDVQAQKFVDAVGTLDRGDFPPTIDIEFETKEGRIGTGLTAGQVIEWVDAAWQVLSAAYNAPPLIYTSARIWNEELGNIAAPQFVESPLWLAKPWPWPVRTTAQRDLAFFADGKHDPNVPPTWGTQWFFHQYQGDALGFPGFSNTVDINRFRPIPQGAVGDHVKWIQRRLGISESGTFDAATRDAVIAHQNHNNLVADGVVGPKTFASLCWS